MSNPVDSALDPKPKPRGGPDFHKPECGCNACKARRRKAEALASRGGIETFQASQILSPDTPEEGVMVTGPRKGPRLHVAKWVALRAQKPDITEKDAAAEMGIATQTLKNCIMIAVKEGWLKFEDPIATLKYQLIPKVADNLNYFLDMRDKQVTIEAAKGTLFKQFQDAEGLKEVPTTILAIKIEHPPGSDGGIPVSFGKVVGKPRTIEAEIIDVTDDAT